MNERLLTLRITLCEAAPPIWRTFVLPSYHSLGELHAVAQAVMGWQDCHLHQFAKGERRFVESDDDFSPDNNTEDEETVTVGELFPHVGSKVEYLYDFGDDWLHEIELERSEPLEDPATLARCTGGARACPPEDCGGIPGYANMLRVLANPNDDSHGDFVEWIGEEFDAEAFSVEEANQRIAELIDDGDHYDDDDDDDDDDEMLDLSYDPLIAPDPEKWLDLSEDEQHFLIAAYHRRLPASELPTQQQLELHAVFHTIVEHQVASNQPPETTAALARLQKEGLDRHDAVHAVGSVVASRMFEALKHGEDPTKDLVKELNELTAAQWLAEQEVEPQQTPARSKSTRVAAKKKK